jgi:hypothetical protein
MQRFLNTRRIAMIIAIAMLCAGCSLSIGSTGIGIDNSTVTTALPVAQMGIQITIDESQINNGQVTAGIRFADSSDHTVEFTHGETVTCNGTALNYTTNPISGTFGYGSYTALLPFRAGGKYSFVFTRPGDAPVTTTVPAISAPLALSNPTDGATVSIPKSAPFVVSFTKSGYQGTINATIIGQGNAPPVTYSGADTGSISLPASDFAQFTPGSGSIVLNRTIPQNPGSTPYLSANAQVTAEAMANITWQ